MEWATPKLKDNLLKPSKKGNVVKCPTNVRHWHGASPDVGLQQLYIVSNTEKGIVQWKESVTDEEYHDNEK